MTNPKTIESTMSLSSGRSFYFKAGSTFAQSFVSQSDSIPTELGVRMGNNQNPYSLNLKLYCHDKLIFEHQFTGCRQRTSDWATVFPLGNIPDPIKKGDPVRFEMTPSPGIGIEPIYTNQSGIEQGLLQGYGKMACRFYLDGRAIPQTPEDPPPEPPTSYTRKDGNYLAPNDILKTREYICADNGSFFLLMQEDGNLCIYRGSDPDDKGSIFWSSGQTGEKGQYFAMMQESGNFCVYRGISPEDNKGVVWQTATSGAGGSCYLVLEDDGNIFIHYGTGPDDNKGLIWFSEVIPESSGQIDPDEQPGEGEFQTVNVRPPDAPPPPGFHVLHTDTWLHMPETANALAGGLAGYNLFPAPARVEYLRTIWLIQGNPIAGYSQDNEEASIEPLVINASPVERQIRWFWWKTGVYSVTLSLTIRVYHDDGPPTLVVHTGSTQYTVRGPELVGTVSRTTDVHLAARNVRVGTNRLTLPFVSFGRPSQLMSDAGIAFGARIFKGPHVLPGHLRFVQLIRSERTFKYINGWTRSYSTDGNYMLDHRVPYPEQGDEPLVGNQVVLYEEDSPEQGLYGPDSPVETFTLEEHFRMYIMWKPYSTGPNTIWVTLARFEWFWETQVIRHPDGTYVLVEPATSYTNQTLPHKTDIELKAYNQLPTWTENIENDLTVLNTPPPQEPDPPPPPPDDPPGMDGEGDSDGSTSERKSMSALRYQGNSKQMVFRFQPPSEHGSPKFTKREAEAAVGRKFDFKVDYRGQKYICVFAPEQQVRQAGTGVVQVEEWPVSARLSDLDLSPTPPSKGRPDPFYEFWIRVAPFCFGNIDYWSLYAHVPTELGNISDPNDYSMGGYLLQLTPLLPQNVQLYSQGNGQLKVVFPQLPSRTLMNNIARLNQTHHVWRVSGPVIDPPGDPLM